QRVGLADALVADPPILILDEPTSGLDPNQRRRMKGLIRELAERHTILFSSHILAEVADVSDRILLIHGGRLAADGPLEQLLQSGPGRRLVVTARLPGAALVELVERASGGSGARAHDDGDGFATVELPLGGTEDPRDAVSAELQGSAVFVRELKLERSTLEDFFAQVTEGSPDGQEPIEVPA